MHSKVCPLCNTKFYSAKKGNTFLQLATGYNSNNCYSKEELSFRTSTPIAEIEDTVLNTSDSVNDFFYKIWKSGLRTDSRLRLKSSMNKENEQKFFLQQPTTQVIYFNTVMCQQILPMPCGYSQPVGYREDGTFGVLPFYWPYYVE